MLGLRRRMDTRVIPRVTFTQPEVAAVGVQAAECVGTRNRVVTIHHAHLDRAIAEGATSGFTQIITDRGGRILGATIVGPSAHTAQPVPEAGRQLNAALMAPLSAMRVWPVM